MKKLRLTTTGPKAFFGLLLPGSDESGPLVVPEDIGEIVDATTLKCRSAYIHGEAEKKAKFDIPVFLDGDMAQLGLPVEQQDIELLLPDGVYKCKSEYYKRSYTEYYLITLFDEESVNANITTEDD
jgi:hypothetical protein